MTNESRITLLVEGYPRNGFQMFSKLLESGQTGVCITRMHPEYVAEKYSLKNAKCYWLSGNKGKETLSPKSLNQLIKVAKSNPGTIMFLDGLEYLLLWNDMGRILDALKDVNQVLAKSGGEMIVPIDPLTLEQKDLEKLWAAFPQYEEGQIAEAISVPVTRQISSFVPRAAPAIP